MDTQTVIDYINSLDPQDKESAQEVIKNLGFVANRIQDRLQEFGLKFEIEAYFGDQWLHGMDYWDYEGDEDYDGYKRGEWVSSSSFSC